MEDALVHNGKFQRMKAYDVLILVLMEDALVLSVSNLLVRYNWS